MIKKYGKGKVAFFAILSLLVISGVLYGYVNTGTFGGIGSYDPLGAESSLLNKSVSLAKQNEVLKELGLTGYSDEEIAAMESAQQPYLDLLTALGTGTYDEETWEWTPGSTDVYAFDCEIFDLSVMYTNFLKGVSAINQNEFTLTDIREDLSQVDFESGTGTYILTFQYNGHPYRFEGKADNDWIDVRVIDFMNQVLKKEDNPKRLLCMSDGGQGIIIFYNTRKWSKKFTAKTSLLLTTGSAVEAPFGF